MEEPTSRAIRIFVDADACPVKQEVYRVAERYGLKVYRGRQFLHDGAAQRHDRARDRPEGPDIADDWIAERAGASDIVITADIPLAGRCVRNKARR